jgi:hypothetical protein
MANLLPPRIKGPVSECSTHIWVQSQFPGATVEVVDTTTGTVVATGLWGQRSLRWSGRPNRAADPPSCPSGWPSL